MELTDFSFNENALFLKVKEGKDMAVVMPEVIKQAQYEKEGRPYQMLVRSVFSDEYPDMFFSFLAYRRKMRPSCIPKEKEIEEMCYERRMAYLLVVEYAGYVVILKRNIYSIRTLRDAVENIDYNVLCKVFHDEHTVYKRFGMSNLDMANYAMRSKSFAAENLESVFSTIGANNFSLTSFQLINNDGRYSLSLDTSKINQAGVKVDLTNLLKWSKMVIDKIVACDESAVENYLSVFAAPVDYSTEYSANHLDPKAILFSLYKLYNEEWIDSVSKEGDDTVLSIEDVCRKFEFALDLQSVDGREHQFFVEIEYGKRIDIKVGEGSISISSDWMNAVILNPKADSDYETESLLSYIKNTGAYTIMFDMPTLKYSNKRLFKDEGLTGNIEVFLSVFKAFDELRLTNSEKGVITNTSKVFSRKSLFRFIEDTYRKDEKIMVCDDLGTEWADYLLIGEESVALFAAKHKDLCFSASAFQEVVGQAQKNLGVFFPLDSMWKTKEEKWEGYYTQNGIKSKIKRVRTQGGAAANAVKLWKRAERSVNYQKDLYLVIDFISLSRLTTALEKLQRREDFPEKKEAIPILWLLSSLWNSCQDLRIRLHITCQP